MSRQTISGLRWRSLGAIGIAVVVIGCGGGQTGLNGSEVGPSPIVLKDTSPGQLTVFVALNMGGYDAATRDKTLVDVNFQHGGRLVEFIAGERVTCNDVALKRFTGSFEGEFLTASIAGKSMSCVYKSRQQSAPFTVGVPQALVILAPLDHEQVRRSPHTTVRYSGGLETNLWVVALSTNAKAVAQSNDITATSATLDTRALGAGEGSIALTDPSSLPLTAIQGAQFQSDGGSARRMTMVAVVWV